MSNERARPRIIVLDIDHTLLHSTPKPEHKGYVLRKNYSNMTMHTKFRPGVKRFLEQLKKLFHEVIVWSAGERKYVHRMVNELFRSCSYYPKAVLTRDHCASMPSADGFRTYYKPLYTVLALKELQAYEPTLSDVLILDDSQYTFTVNDASGLTAHRFSGDSNDAFLNSITTHLKSALAKSEKTEPLTSIILKT